MKADLHLSERRRLDAADQRAFRASPIRRHTEGRDQQHAIEPSQIAFHIGEPASRASVERLRG